MNYVKTTSSNQKVWTLKLLSVCFATSLLLSACGNLFSPETRKPVALIALSNPQASLTQVFGANLKSEQGLLKRNTINSANLQMVVMDNGHILTAYGDAVQLLGQSGVVWRVNVGAMIGSGVSFDKGSQTAVVATENGDVIALDVKTGGVRWRSAFNAVVLAPAVMANNRVLLSANNGVFYGLNLQNGAVVWQYATQPTGMSVRGIAKPLQLDENTAVFASAEGRIYALLIDSGKEIWSRRVGAPIGGNVVEQLVDVDGIPYLDGNRLYVTSYSGQFMAFDMSTGQTIFAQRGFATNKSIALLSDRLIGVDNDGMVYGFDAQSGRKLWQNNALKFRRPSNPVAIGDYVAVGDYEGVVHLFNRSGNLIGRSDAKRTQGQIVSLQAKANQLYVQTATGQLAVWRIQ